MKVTAETKKLQRQLENDRKLLKAFGSQVANKIMQRITELQAAENLSAISHLPPPRLHMLTGDYQNYFSVDLTGNMRLIFRGFNSSENPTIL
ncbi:type II toxin-antitoxin system RelE/ParE family toxin [Secundilactobacillus kimchicus]|uniref:type II toxin-antitoxin system RelE/ParE family toxin n=1 Tax=Secundilactobacillus kimchicus TaxID=528209 RepID=UPI001C00BA15